MNQRFQYVNYNTAALRGVEAGARVSVSTWLLADVGYAWLDATATFDGVSRRLPGRAGRQAKKF